MSNTIQHNIDSQLKEDVREVSVIQLANASSLTESRISASAAGVRGLIIHLNGAGYLSVSQNKMVRPLLRFNIL